LLLWQQQQQLLPTGQLCLQQPGSFAAPADAAYAAATAAVAAYDPMLWQQQQQQQHHQYLLLQQQQQQWLAPVPQRKRFYDTPAGKPKYNSQLSKSSSGSSSSSSGDVIHITVPNIMVRSGTDILNSSSVSNSSTISSTIDAPQLGAIPLAAAAGPAANPAATNGSSSSSSSVRLSLEWLRGKPVSEVRSFLTSVYGLGRKSIACVSLLTLGLRDFPVDVNVGRICARLGWIPLQVRCSNAAGLPVGFARRQTAHCLKSRICARLG
jgi:hypothetical protein